MSSSVPNPQTESFSPKNNIPSPAAAVNVKDRASSFTSKIEPDHAEYKHVEGDLTSDPGEPKESTTLAEEFIHFLKINKAPSEEEVMAFMIPATVRRAQAGLSANAPMRTPEAQQSVTSQKPFTRQDFHRLIKKAVTPPAPKPDPKGK